MRFALAMGILALSSVASDQAPPTLQFNGKPIRIECSCTPDDMQSAGLTCTEEEPCPLYLELTAVESVGNKIFTAGNFHTDSATLYSVVLASDDSGKTWREPFERLKASGLDHIQFVDFENGWISGQSLQPFPQDPFFLITTDGGKTWRRRPVFGENRAGAISQFWFSSRSNGSLVIDRGETGQHELYETPNGGETWMVREVNEKPLRLRRTASGNADWRIRADKTTQAFWIERRQGEKWTGLAAFAVRAGACKPAARVEEAPPPADEPAPSAPAEIRRTPPSLKKPR
jgi:hypothetical protein